MKSDGDPQTAARELSPMCTTDEDCEQNEFRTRCNGWVCVMETIECSTDDDCPEGTRCQLVGFVPNPESSDVTELPDGYCTPESSESPGPGEPGEPPSEEGGVAMCPLWVLAECIGGEYVTPDGTDDNDCPLPPVCTCPDGSLPEDGMNC